MWQDPIVAETRALREQYADQFDHNADAIFQDILLRQTASGKKLVSFRHRQPVLSHMTIPFRPVARSASGSGSTSGEKADMARHTRRSRRSHGSRGGGVVL